MGNARLEADRTVAADAVLLRDPLSLMLVRQLAVGCIIASLPSVVIQSSVLSLSHDHRAHFGDGDTLCPLLDQWFGLAPFCQPSATAGEVNKAPRRALTNMNERMQTSQYLPTHL